MPRRVAFGCDHAAFGARQEIIEFIKASSAVSDVIYMGPTSDDSVDYPDFAEKVCEAIIKGDADVGVLVCGTGIGMSIAANKFSGIRAALCHDHVTAQLSRQHNDANVVCMGLRTSGLEVIRDIVTTFLTTDFTNGGRHVGRVAKIHAIEEKTLH